MGKQCLTKLSGNITVGCTLPQVGIKNIYLINTDDVKLTLSSANTYVSSITFAKDAKSILVEGYKQNIQVTGSLRTMDASVKQDISVVFKLPRTGSYVAQTRSLITGKFYVLVEEANGEHTFVGAVSPLECSGYDFDSNANAGMITVTLTAPEGSAGNYFTYATADAVNAIKSNVGA
jgi:hypothetical protein